MHEAHHCERSVPSDRSANRRVRGVGAGRGQLQHKKTQVENEISQPDMCACVVGGVCSGLATDNSVHLTRTCQSTEDQNNEPRWKL